MTNWIISSSVLILIVICMRHFLKGKISAKLQYAMWLLVAVRLLVPINFGSSILSVENVTDRFYPVSVENAVSGTAKEETIYNEIVEDVVAPMEVPGNDVNHETTYVPTENEVSYTDILQGIWLIGIGCTAGVFILTNTIFQRKVKKNREAIYVNGCKIAVFVSDEVETPCLAGLFLPKIYVTKEVAEHTTLLRHTATHEMMHYKQGDSFWAIVRCVCLALHWYNPLVWCATILSKKDAELSCDEATIKVLGEKERKEYGKTLIELSSKEKYNLFITATAMTSGKESIKERIVFIAKKPNMKWYTVAVCVLIACIAVGCTFTEGKSSSETEEDQSKFSFAVKVSEEKELTIKLDVSLLRDDYYKVNEILVYDGDEHIQTIQTPTTAPTEEYAWDGLFVNYGHEVGEPDVRDLSFDGAEDFGLMTVETYPKNVPYSYFIWNADKNCFEYGFTKFGASQLQVLETFPYLVETREEASGIIEEIEPITFYEEPELNDMIAARQLILEFTKAYFESDLETIQAYMLPTSSSSVAITGYEESEETPIIYNIKGLEDCIYNSSPIISVEFKVSEDADYYVYLEMNIRKHEGEWKVESYWLEQ